MKQTLLVTGGAGYLGSVLVPLALEQGHRVRVFDRFLFGEDALDAVRNNPRLEIAAGDVRRLQEHPNLFDGVDAVIHLAAVDAEAICRDYPVMTRDVNVASTAEFARLASQAGVRRFVHASSCVQEGEFAAQSRDAERAVLKLASNGFAPVVARLAPLCGVSPRMRFDLDHNGENAALPVFDAARALLTLTTNAKSDTVEISSLDYADSTPVRSSTIARVTAMAIAIMTRGVVDAFVKSSGIDPKDDRYNNERVMRHILSKPVEDGGEPIAPRFIPLARPVMDAEEEDAVLETMRSGWITSGPQIAAFERAFAEAVSAPFAVPMVSCTAALHLCLVDAGVKAGDEVITTPITWASTGNTILNMGATPVFVDVEPDTLNLDASKLEAAVTPRTRAIMPVHLAGQPCDLDAIYATANRHNIAVIEDAAHALGAHYTTRAIGEATRYACFSFYAIKNITTIEGGAIATNDEETAKRLRLLASNGMSATAWDRYGRSAAPGPSEVVVPGYKYLMGNVSAAMGLVQLKKWPQFKTDRATLAARYLELLAEVEDAAPLAVRPNRVNAWHLMIVRLDLQRLTRTRDEIAQALRRENIGTGVHFYGLHLHQYYRETLGMRAEDFPEATAASRAILSLPLYPAMTETDVEHVVAALKKVLKHAAL